MAVVLLVLCITVFLFVSEIVHVGFAAIIAVGLDRAGVMLVVATWITKVGGSTEARGSRHQCPDQRRPNPREAISSSPSGLGQWRFGLLQSDL
jgi:hypothetical protein